MQRARFDIGMDGAARYKIEPDDHFDQSYNRQNRMGPLKPVQCVLIREVILRKLRTFFRAFVYHRALHWPSHGDIFW